MNWQDLIKDIIVPLATFLAGYLGARRGRFTSHIDLIYQKQLEACTEVAGTLYAVSASRTKKDMSDALHLFKDTWDNNAVLLPDDANRALLAYYTTAIVVSVSDDSKYEEDLPKKAFEANAVLRRTIGVQPLSAEMRGVFKNLANAKATTDS